MYLLKNTSTFPFPHSNSPWTHSPVGHVVSSETPDHHIFSSLMDLSTFTQYPTTCSDTRAIYFHTFYAYIFEEYRGRHYIFHCFYVCFFFSWSSLQHFPSFKLERNGKKKKERTNEQNIHLVPGVCFVIFIFFSFFFNRPLCIKMNRTKKAAQHA